MLSSVRSTNDAFARVPVAGDEDQPQRRHVAHPVAVVHEALVEEALGQEQGADAERGRECQLAGDEERSGALLPRPPPLRLPPASVCQTAGEALRATGARPQATPATRVTTAVKTIACRRPQANR